MSTANDEPDSIVFWDTILLLELERILIPGETAEKILLPDTKLPDDWLVIYSPRELMPVVEIVLLSIVLPELELKEIPCEKVLRVVMELFDISLVLELNNAIPDDKVPLVSMMQFFISMPVTSKAEMLGEDLKPVVVILKPAQSRITLFDPAPLRRRATEGQFMSESSVVLVVNVVLQGGVTACTDVVLSSIKMTTSHPGRKYL